MTDLRNSNTDMKKYTKNIKTAGFSLIEIMIVITLIGLVTTFAVQNFMAKQEEGKRKGAKILMHGLKAALDDFYRTCNNYPTDGQGGLTALLEKPSDNSCKDYDPNGYLQTKTVPKDPWGRDFIYSSPDGRKFVLKSLGGDGKEGGDKNDKDISTEDEDF